MGIKKLAAVAVVATVVATPPVHAQSTLPLVTIEGRSTPPSGGMSFDGFMSTYFGGPTFSSNGFSEPEGEAYQTGFKDWIKKLFQPKAAITMDSCAMDNAAAARNITKNSEPTERINAAREIYFQNLPNFINTKKDGLIFAVIFGDASQELYQHTTFYGVIPVKDSFQPGTGFSRCPG